MFTSDDQSSDDVNGETSDGNGHSTPSASIHLALTITRLSAVVWLDVEVDTSVIDGYFDTVCICSKAAAKPAGAQGSSGLLTAPYLPMRLPHDDTLHAMCRSASTTKYLPQQTPRYERANRCAHHYALQLLVLIDLTDCLPARWTAAPKLSETKFKQGSWFAALSIRTLWRPSTSTVCPCSSHCAPVLHVVIAALWRHNYVRLCSYEYRYQQFSAVGGGEWSLPCWPMIICLLRAACGRTLLTLRPALPCAQHITS